jgi:hypothetical protein
MRSNVIPIYQRGAGEAQSVRPLGNVVGNPLSPRIRRDS